MFLIQIKTVVTISVMVLLGVGFTLAVKARLSNPTSGYELAARERGGVFLGVEGVVMQDRGKTCGPASLKMILDVYGKTVTLRDLEKGATAPGEGWSMQSLKGLAERYGLVAEGWRLDLESLRRSQFPVILFVEKRHFMVVDGVDTSGCFLVRDPAIGRMKIHRRALGRLWTGETLVFRENRSSNE